jgi:NCK adaptor protein
LTLKATPKNKHFRIQQENGSFCIGQQTFDTLDDLVDHYKKHPIFRSGKEKLYLAKTFSHPEEGEPC